MHISKASIMDECEAGVGHIQGHDANWRTSGSEEATKTIESWGP